jgi:hypothetical protein
MKLGLTPYRKNTLIMCERRVLMRIFESKREEIMGGWRNLHNSELFNFRHVTCIEKMRNVYKILVRRREGPL